MCCDNVALARSRLRFWQGMNGSTAKRMPRVRYVRDGMSGELASMAKEG
jgi:hypothetical protein